jgi:hypothetical protein
MILLFFKVTGEGLLDLVLRELFRRRAKLILSLRAPPRPGIPAFQSIPHCIITEPSVVFLRARPATRFASAVHAGELTRRVVSDDTHNSVVTGLDMSTCAATNYGRRSCGEREGDHSHEK